MENFAHSLHLHPALVHFPLALFITAFGFEIVSLVLKKENFHHTAFYLYVLAAALSPVAVQTGLWEENVLKIHHPVLETHETFALITMWTALVSLPVLWLVKKKWPGFLRWAFLFFTLVTAAAVSTAAYNGGKMVYEYGIGTEQ